MKIKALALPFLCLTMGLASCSAASDAKFLENGVAYAETLTGHADTTYTSTISGFAMDVWSSSTADPDDLTFEGNVDLDYYQYVTWEAPTDDPLATNPYEETYEDSLSTLLHVPMMISADSFHVAYDGTYEDQPQPAMFEFSDTLLQNLAGNTAGRLKVRQEKDGGVHVYVRNSRFTCWIYGLSGTYHGMEFSGRRAFRGNAAWDIDLYYDSTGVLTREVVKTHDYTTDRSGRFDLEAVYTIA